MRTWPASLAFHFERLTVYSQRGREAAGWAAFLEKGAVKRWQAAVGFLCCLLCFGSTALRVCLSGMRVCCASMCLLCGRSACLRRVGSSHGLCHGLCRRNAPHTAREALRWDLVRLERFLFQLSGLVCCRPLHVVASWRGGAERKRVFSQRTCWRFSPLRLIIICPPLLPQCDDDGPATILL